MATGLNIGQKKRRLLAEGKQGVDWAKACFHPKWSTLKPSYLEALQHVSREVVVMPESSRMLKSTTTLTHNYNDLQAKAKFPPFPAVPCMDFFKDKPRFSGCPNITKKPEMEEALKKAREGWEADIKKGNQALEDADGIKEACEAISKAQEALMKDKCKRAREKGQAACEERKKARLITFKED